MTTQTTTESPMKTEDDFYTLTDLLKFTEEFFSMAMIEIDAKQQLVTQRLTAAVKEEAYIYYRDRIRHFRIDEAEREPDSKKRRKIEYATKSLFDIYFNRYVELMGLKKEYDFKESLTFDGSSFDELDKIIQCLKVPGFNREVLAHWMWLVKSSMYYPERLKYHPFMLLLVSQTQGLGKSTFIRELVKPLRPFVSDASIDQITDSRFQYSMMSNYIVVLDEMAKIQKTDINALKRVVTNGSATIRPLFENKIKDVRNNAIFIGMTNKRLIESIYDPMALLLELAV